MCSDLLNMFPNIASIDWSMSMFTFDAMALNEHINPKMLVSIDFILQNGVDTFSNGPVN